MRTQLSEEIVIPAEDAEIRGTFTIPASSSGVVVFAHGSGSGRFSPRNRFVAEHLQRAGLATLLIDLLTEAEEREDARTAEIRFDIPLLSQRLLTAASWLDDQDRIVEPQIGFFGASTGAAAALVAAAHRPHRIGAIVSRGGRPDLAMTDLALVHAPTLLIVGGNDRVVLELNRQAFEALAVEKRLEVVPGATHLFEEPEALEAVSTLAADWFAAHLT